MSKLTRVDPSEMGLWKSALSPLIEMAVTGKLTMHHVKLVDGAITAERNEITRQKELIALEQSRIELEVQRKKLAFVDENEAANLDMKRAKINEINARAYAMVGKQS